MQKDFSDRAWSSVRTHRLESYEFAAGVGQPCGASHISRAYTCKIGGGMSWDEKAGQVGPKTRAAVAGLQETLERVKPQKLQDMWKAEVDSMMGESPKLYHSHADKKGGEPKPYSEGEIDTGMAGRAKGITKLIENGYPENVKFRDGSVEAAPPGMTPFVTAKGQGGWVHPTNGLKYNTQDDGTATQNRAGLFDSARRAQDITDFRESQMRSGKPWPTQELPPSPGEKQMDGKKVFESLSSKEIDSIALRGIPLSGTGPAAQMKQYYQDNPGEKVARAREICDQYAKLNGRSGISNKPIPLPGLAAKPGQEKSTVDHFEETSSSGKGMSAKQFRQKVDKGSNFLLCEEGPNAQRTDKEWDVWATKSLPKLTAMKGPSKAELAKIPDWTGSPKISTQKPKRSDKSPGAEARREAIARSEKRVKEIQQQSGAAQKSKYQKLQQEARKRGDDDAADYWKTAIGNLE